jgi:hypothetical protein
VSLPSLLIELAGDTGGALGGLGSVLPRVEALTALRALAHNYLPTLGPHRTPTLALITQLLQAAPAAATPPRPSASGTRAELSSTSAASATVSSAAAGAVVGTSVGADERLAQHAAKLLAEVLRQVSGIVCCAAFLIPATLLSKGFPSEASQMNIAVLTGEISADGRKREKRDVADAIEHLCPTGVRRLGGCGRSGGHTAASAVSASGERAGGWGIVVVVVGSGGGGGRLVDAAHAVGAGGGDAAPCASGAPCRGWSRAPGQVEESHWRVCLWS